MQEPAWLRAADDDAVPCDFVRSFSSGLVYVPFKVAVTVDAVQDTSNIESAATVVGWQLKISPGYGRSMVFASLYGLRPMMIFVGVQFTCGVGASVGGAGVGSGVGHQVGGDDRLTVTRLTHISTNQVSFACLHRTMVILAVAQQSPSCLALS